MVFDSSDLNRGASIFSDNANHVRVQFMADFFAEKRGTQLCAENNVNENIGKGLRHLQDSIPPRWGLVYWIGHSQAFGLGFRISARWASGIQRLQSGSGYWEDGRFGGLKGHHSIALAEGQGLQRPDDWSPKGARFIFRSDCMSPRWGLVRWIGLSQACGPGCRISARWASGLVDSFRAGR